MSSSPGLRERKKLKTRRTIQDVALRLFAEQGYDATTVEQIAAAAEVSPSTFFRYYPTKEDVLIEDDYDPMLFEALVAQPAELSPIQAMRSAFASVTDLVPAEEQESLLSRVRLAMSIPAVRARTMDNLTSTIDMMAAALARRAGRDQHTLTDRTLAGALLGAMLPALFDWLESGTAGSLFAYIDASLDALDAITAPGRPPAD
ncbi:TetR family transcriptional regulator [Streptosporangiaceae bacterium NEAU-GS5]|nr:TetR family transcriptional regulator [Streptosporangiaceae bacterium NEAU-GS5]